jgi:hypothetical protein
MLVAGILLTSLVGSAAAAPCTTTAGVATCVFTKGLAQTWIVPAGGPTANFDVYGAQGGGNFPPNLGPGLGGRATATMPVFSGESIQVNVGGAGDYVAPFGSGGGLNGGGQASSIVGNQGFGAGGGGASDVRIGGTSLFDRALVAGGGGGSGGCSLGGSPAVPASRGNDGAGGGGGSGHGPVGTTFSTGVHQGDGLVIITYPVQCSPGSYSATGYGPCTAASPGNYVSTAGATGQTPCTPGTFQPNSGATSCNQADPGHFVAGTASATQAACSLGTYQPASGQMSCIPAGIGYYVDTTGATAQTPCPGDETTATTGSTSIGDCFVPGMLLTTKAQAMDGDLKVAQGSTLSAGFDFTMPGGHPAATVGFLAASVTFNATCASGTPGSQTIVVNITDQSYLDPANSSAWYPSGDQNDVLTYQGSATVPSFCDPGSLVRLQLGGTFSTHVTSSDTQDKVNVRWHYKDGTGGGWSGTYSVIPS